MLTVRRLRSFSFVRFRVVAIQPKRDPTIRVSICHRMLASHAAVLFLLAQLSVVGPAWSQSPSGSELSEPYEVRPAAVNLRAGPGTQYDAIGQLGRGERVHVSSVYDGWAEVVADDGWHEGWIRADLLTVVDPIPSLSDFSADHWPIGIGLLLLLLLYLFPFTIAIGRGHHNAAAIFALNLLLGWSGWGWVAALVWALTAVDEAKKKSYAY